MENEDDRRLCIAERYLKNKENRGIWAPWAGWESRSPAVLSPRFYPGGRWKKVLTAGAKDVLSNAVYLETFIITMNAFSDQ